MGWIESGREERKMEARAKKGEKEARGEEELCFSEELKTKPPV